MCQLLALCQSNHQKVLILVLQLRKSKIPACKTYSWSSSLPIPESSPILPRTHCAFAKKNSFFLFYETGCWIPSDLVQCLLDHDSPFEIASAASKTWLFVNPTGTEWYPTGSCCYHNTGDITEDSSSLLDTGECPRKALLMMSLGTAMTYLLIRSLQIDQFLGCAFLELLFWPRERPLATSPFKARDFSLLN